MLLLAGVVVVVVFAAATIVAGSPVSLGAATPLSSAATASKQGEVVASVATYYVSPFGSDSNNGSKDAPFQTIQRAQEAARVGAKKGAVDVQIGPGLYSLKEPLVFTSKDSGLSSDAPVTYKSTGGGNPFIMGGVQLPLEWASVGQYPACDLWELDVSKSVPPGTYIRQMWVGDRRFSMARQPEMSYVNATANSITYEPGQQASVPENLDDVILVVYLSWTANPYFIETFNTTSRTITFNGTLNTAYAPPYRYYLLNVREELTSAPYQLYHNRKTNMLQACFPKNAEPAQLPIFVPTLDEVLVVAGDSTSGEKVEHLRFEHLDIAYTKDTLDACRVSKCGGQSGSFLTTAAVHASVATDIVFHNISVSHTGSYSVWFDSGTTNSALTASTVSDNGAGAVRIASTSNVQEMPLVLPHDPQSKSSSSNNNTSHTSTREGLVVDVHASLSDPALLVQNITVTENILEDGGHVILEGCGVLSQHASGVTITHNLIRHFKYTGVSTGWTWGYKDTVVFNMNVSYNYIQDIGEGLLNDMGCIYTLGRQQNSIVDHNICRNVTFHGRYGGWGLYSDEGTSFIDWTNNIVYNTDSAGVHQHYGMNVTYSNNIFADVDRTYQGGAIRSSPSNFPCNLSHPLQSCTSFTFERNIAYMPKGPMFKQTTDFAFNNATMDKNVYWQIDKSPVVFPNGLNFTQWQALGKDVHSVIADPLFPNASEDDFSKLSPDSPAIKLGFVPIDISQVGPTLGGSAGQERMKKQREETAQYLAKKKMAGLFKP